MLNLFSFSAASSWAKVAPEERTTSVLSLIIITDFAAPAFRLEASSQKPPSSGFFSMANILNNNRYLAARWCESQRPASVARKSRASQRRPLACLSRIRFNLRLHREPFKGKTDTYLRSTRVHFCVLFHLVVRIPPVSSVCLRILYKNLPTRQKQHIWREFHELQTKESIDTQDYHYCGISLSVCPPVRLCFPTAARLSGASARNLRRSSHLANAR